MSDNSGKQKSYLDGLIKKAQLAENAYLGMTQEQIIEIVRKAANAAGHKRTALLLAKMAVEETGRGRVEHKRIKNLYAVEFVLKNILPLKTVGVVEECKQEGYAVIAKPVGTIAALTPTTNPTSTVIFKALMALMTRNPIIFAPHPAATNCSIEAARIIRDAAIAAGAPEDCIQWIEPPYMSKETTTELMKHPGVKVVLATGGAQMSKAAYSSGKPAIGVGPGNAPCYIHSSANLEQACNDIILSVTFDYGMICATERAVILDKSIAGRFESIMTQNCCYFLTAEETALLTSYMFGEENRLNPDPVGRSATWIAEQAGIEVPEGTEILLAPLSGVGEEYPLSQEKLSPVLAYYTVDGVEQATEVACAILELNGEGHTAAIHIAEDNEDIKVYMHAVNAGRVIVNSPSAHGAIGGLYNNLVPSLTLGCGSYGGNGTTDNVTAGHLLNYIRVAYRRDKKLWFRNPPDIHRGMYSTSHLQVVDDVERVFIVTDDTMVELGYVDIVRRELAKRSNAVEVRLFTDVEPDPSIQTVERGVQAMRDFQPDTIIALGGGSPMDAAKIMRLLYEHPELSLEDLTMPFLDINKRVVKFPKLGAKVRKLICIPTTSGTGSEVTPFAVITDKVTGEKYPIADYVLTPEVAIVDPQYVLSAPKWVVADTGADVLTHAIEALVSALATSTTDAHAYEAIKLVFNNFVKSYNGDAKARENMHYASLEAGLAFANAFLGINHSLAHKIGAEYGVPHGRANAILLPHVIRYNSERPTLRVAFPNYSKPMAASKYAALAKSLGLSASTEEEGVASLIRAIQDLFKQVKLPSRLRECDGITEEDFMKVVGDLAELAFEDQCTSANPRLPEISDLRDLYIKAF
ncbi:MAG: bifunctional acetaldehyde-CoA/alcohol dehydrogenase [Oscillospiraceae bacterium]|nr:bifunctional acetaldehyde-CoA/alcohol dehydrogenase [Oscillospiraceae bacterium]